ncbi:DinB family protein [soil metagenome]
MDLPALLADQLDWHWTNSLRPRFEGLTDDEYLWEPVEGCWSIRPREDARTPMAAGAGTHVADFEIPEPEPAPVTTIAWRLGHIAVGIFGARAASHFEGEPMLYESTEWSPTAEGGLDLVDRTYESWIQGVKSLTAADLEKPVGEAEGPFAEHSMAELILHINREAIHHGAEVALLRDLYRHRDS